MKRFGQFFLYVVVSKGVFVLLFIFVMFIIRQFGGQNLPTRYPTMAGLARLGQLSVLLMGFNFQMPRMAFARNPGLSFWLGAKIGTLFLIVSICIIGFGYKSESVQVVIHGFRLVLSGCEILIGSLVGVLMMRLITPSGLDMSTLNKRL